MAMGHGNTSIFSLILTPLQDSIQPQKEAIPNATADKFLGVFLIICMVIGIPCNTLSFCYFFRRLDKSVHYMLYMLASITDTCTLAMAFAPIIVLLSDSGRSGMVFEDPALCKSWTVIFYFAARFSQAVVLLISITRTIAIKSPLHRLSRKMVLWTCIIYAIWLLSKDIIFFSVGAVSIGKYRNEWASCVYERYKGSLLFVVSAILEILGVTLIIVANFFTCLTYLAKKPLLLTSDGVKFRQVSVTIAIFTAMCLACTAPVCIVMTLQILHIPLANTSLSFYIKFVPYVFLLVLNAALNPVIYISRMPSYSRWVSEMSGRCVRVFVGDVSFVMLEEEKKEENQPADETNTTKL